MLLRLWIIGAFVLLLGALWLLSANLTPQRGFLRGAEKLFIGVILCYVLGLIARPLGLLPPTGPISAAFAGVLGFPGAVLALLLSNG